MSDQKDKPAQIPVKTKFNIDWDFIEENMPSEQGLGRPAPVEPKKG